MSSSCGPKKFFESKLTLYRSFNPVLCTPSQDNGFHPSAVGLQGAHCLEAFDVALVIIKVLIGHATGPERAGECGQKVLDLLEAGKEPDNPLKACCESLWAE